ncbi:hypothetical protein [Agrilutibacter solisilvae]|uniref:Uncharacterized protein n=1 Tax=Agrilutibacter solisilvae TaxID=2763317 RepID=A0A974Y339_9GAMM|nr:hypothetical protein [Lysobacter solisilvae]QSX79730.1 hypothetical protein I8J32_007805 [Lysobacter solisilvae]
MIKRASLVALLLCSNSSIAALPQYARLTILDRGFEDRWPVATSFYVDESKHEIIFGDSAIILEPCDSSWRCLETPFMTFAVPTNCSMISSSGRWVYKDLSYRISTVLNPDETDVASLRYAVEVRNADDERVATAIYSSGRGLLLIGMIRSDHGTSRLDHYSLVSEHGALSGGCPIKWGPRSKEIKGDGGN